MPTQDESGVLTDAKLFDHAAKQIEKQKADFKKHVDSARSALKKMDDTPSLPPAVKLGLLRSDYEAYLIYTETLFARIMP